MDFPLTLTHDASLIEQIATPQTASAHNVNNVMVVWMFFPGKVIPRIQVPLNSWSDTHISSLICSFFVVF